ncbi:MAG: methionine gamma-lyase family protein, partial [Clostridiales bacterium]|nr:methionine gamma-lyase family protein [Clostridiales bacterium]
MYGKLIDTAIEKLSDQFKAVDEIAFVNQKKVLNAVINNRVALRHVNPTTG